jgi:regulatory protein
VQALRAAAISHLGRRDFSAADLCAKLRARGFDAAATELVISELTACGTLNEARYAQSYVCWHAGRGQGPLRIGADLRKRGVAQALIDAALGEQQDGLALARKVRRAKFGPEPPTSPRESARQIRFLRYRGFSSDHIRAATGADPDWNEET